MLMVRHIQRAVVIAVTARISCAVRDKPFVVGSAAMTTPIGIAAANPAQVFTPTTTCARPGAATALKTRVLSLLDLRASRNPLQGRIAATASRFYVPWTSGSVVASYWYTQLACMPPLWALTRWRTLYMKFRYIFSSGEC